MNVKEKHENKKGRDRDSVFQPMVIHHTRVCDSIAHRGHRTRMAGYLMLVVTLAPVTPLAEIHRGRSFLLCSVLEHAHLVGVLLDVGLEALREGDARRRQVGESAPDKQSAFALGARALPRAMAKTRITQSYKAKDPRRRLHLFIKGSEGTVMAEIGPQQLLDPIPLSYERADLGVMLIALIPRRNEFDLTRRGAAGVRSTSNEAVQHRARTAQE